MGILVGLVMTIGYRRQPVEVSRAGTTEQGRRWVAEAAVQERTQAVKVAEQVKTTVVGFAGLAAMRAENLWAE